MTALLDLTGPRPPASAGEMQERLVFVADGLRAIRKASVLLGGRGEQMRQAAERLIAEVNAIRVGLPDIVAAPVEKHHQRRASSDRARNKPGWQSKNRVNPHTGIEERFCPRHHAGQGAWVPVECFGVKDPVKGTLRYCCQDCFREYQRERYVAANKRAIIIEVCEGDKIVGAICNGCGAPFEIGDLVAGTHLRHNTCVPTPQLEVLR